MTHRDFDVQRQFGGTWRSVRVRVRGVGNACPPCIALHSGPGFGGASLVAGCDDIAHVVQVAFIDLPGCGEPSRHLRSSYPMAAYVADVWAVHVTPRATTSLLLGLGWGAILAAEAARANPASTAGLLLVNTLHVLGAAGQEREAQARRIAAVNGSLPEGLGRAVWPLVQQARVDPALWDDVDRHSWWTGALDTQWDASPPPAWCEAIGIARCGMEAHCAHMLAAFFDPESAWVRYDLAPTLSRVACPVAVLASKVIANDVAPPHIHAPPLLLACADLQLHLVQRVGHSMPSEAPQLVTAAMQRHPAMRIH